MYEISVESNFSAAHKLRNYKGRCEELHGHNWKVRADITSKGLNEIGIVADFKEIKERLEGILEYLDHKYLNELTYFKKFNPTSENIAKYLYDKLQSAIKNKRLKVLRVTVWESDTSSATYSEK